MVARDRSQEGRRIRERTVDRSLLLLALRTHAPDLTVAGACANLMFVGNALPRPPSQNSPVANDGWQIVKCLTKSWWARGQAHRSRPQAGVVALVDAGRTSEVAS